MTPDDDLVAHFDRLLAGEAAGADSELGVLADVIAQLQGMASAIPAGGDAWISRQAAVAAASVREAKVVSLPTSGNRQRKLRAGVAAAAAAVLLTGGLAVADTLPDPIQHVVSRIVGVVGIHVPDPDDPGADGPGKDGTTDPTPDAIPDETPVGPGESTGPGTDDDRAKDGTPATAEGPGADPSLPPVVPGPGVPPSTEPPPSTDPGPPPSATPTAPSTSVVVPVPTTPVVTTPPRPTPTTGGRPDDAGKKTSSGDGA